MKKSVNVLTYYIEVRDKTARFNPKTNCNKLSRGLSCKITILLNIFSVLITVVMVCALFIRYNGYNAVQILL